jgi:hypothetical protein
MNERPNTLHESDILTGRRQRGIDDVQIREFASI